MMWQLELFIVASILVVVLVETGSQPAEALGTIAVILTFCHAQVSDRMAEREARRVTPDVHCYRWSLRYFVAKEAVWLAYFVMHKSWSALAGVGIFLVYPLWRRWYRRYFPLV